jgi:hypothetical protein
MKRWQIGSAIGASVVILATTLMAIQAPTASAKIGGRGHVTVQVERNGASTDFRLHVSCHNTGTTTWKVYTRQRIEYQFDDGPWQSYPQTQQGKKTLKRGESTHHYSPTHWVSWGTRWRVWGDCLRWDPDEGQYKRAYVTSKIWDDRYIA